MTSEAARRASCHCGGVEIRVRGPIDFALKCNCSICTMKGMLHWIVERDRFELVSGQELLSCYQFGTKKAQHYFCSVCGVSPYYIPRSHPDKVDINLRCVDGLDLDSINLEPFDGRNWEQARGELDS